MADNLVKLLFEIAGNTAGAQNATKDLRSTFGVEMDQIGKIVNTTFSQIESKAAYSYGYLGLGARGLARGILSAANEAAKGVESASSGVQALTKDFEKLSEKTGLPVEALRVLARSFSAMGDDLSTKYLIGFRAFGNQAETVVPQLEKLAVQMTAVDAAEAGIASAAEAAGVSLGAVAGVVAIAVVAVAAFALGLYEVETHLFDATERAAKYGDEIYRASLRTKLSTETLSGLHLATDENATSFETLVRGLGRYLKNLDDAAKGNKALRKEFQDLGIDVEKSVQNPREAINQLVVAVNNLGASAGENQALIKLLGFRADQLIPVFRQLGGDIDATTGKPRDLGVVMSEDDARAAHNFQVQLADLRNLLLGVAIAIGKDLGPEFYQLIGNITELVRVSSPLLTLITTPMIGATILLNNAMRDLSDTVALLTLNYDALKRSAKEYADAQEGDIPKVKITDQQYQKAVGPGSTPTSDDDELSLKQKLKAAQDLAEEAKKTEQGVTADLKLQLDERKISFNDYIGGRKAALQVMLADQEKAADLEVEALSNAKKKETETAQQFFERISLEREKAEQRKRDAQQDYDRQATQLDAEAKREELARAEAHRQRMLNLATLDDQRRVAAIQEKNRTAVGYEAQAAKEIADIELAALDRRKTHYEKEKTLAGANIADRQKAEDELAKIAKERAALEDKTRTQETVAKEKDIREAADRDRQELAERRIALNAFIAQERDMAQQGAITFEEAERKIARRQMALMQAELTILDTELSALLAIGNTKAADQIKAQKRILQAQIDAFIEESNRILGTKGLGPGGHAGTAETEDLKTQQQHIAAAEQYYSRIKEVIRAGELETIKLMGDASGKREEIIKREHKVTQDELEDRYQLEARALLREKELLSVDEQARKKNAEEIAAINKLLTALGLQHLNDLIKLANDEKRALAPLNPTSAASIFGTRFAEILKQIRTEAALTGKSISTLSANVQAFGLTLSEHLEQVIQQLPKLIDLTNKLVDDTISGLGAMVKQWVLYGETGPAAIRKVLAEALAAFAEQALVNALYYTAQGLVDIFFFPARAAADFEAVGIWAGIAGLAGLGGRAAAGNLFAAKSGSASTSAGSSATGSSSQSNQGQPIVMGSQRGPSVLHLIIETTGGSAFETRVVSAVIKNANTGGAVREVIVKEIGRQQ